MFICSLRASTLKFFSAVLLSLALFLTILILVEPTVVDAGAEPEATEVVNYSGVRTDEERREFLSSFGWQTGDAPADEEDFVLPADFDRVLAGYNEIQKEQGLDLSRYRNKKVTRYTYEVAGYPDFEGKVYANLIVYKNKVVAADICSADPYGFVHGLKKD